MTVHLRAHYLCPLMDTRIVFNKLTSKEKVNDFFKEVFPNFYELMPDIAEQWEQHSTFVISYYSMLSMDSWENGLDG